MVGISDPTRCLEAAEPLGSFVTMRLIKVDCMGYRRFLNTAEMDVDRDLICVVGPNAAGKSSFLEALTRLNDNDDFEGIEITRNAAAGTTTQVRARFVLEPDERALLDDIPEAREARQLIVFKRNGGRVRALVEPPPERDHRARGDVRERLERLMRDQWFAARVDSDLTAEVDDEERHDIVFEAATGVLQNSSDSLPADEIVKLSEVLSPLRAAEDLPYRFRGLPGRLEQLVAYERQEPPHTRALQRLLPGKPRFLLFNDNARELGPRYDLNDDSDEAVVNLLRLAGTSWNEARALIQRGDAGQKAAWLERVNEGLAQTITVDWGQSDLKVHVHLDGSWLTILMRMQTHDYLDIDQQSDGLRQFVALREFVALTDEEVKPIVLIDEAETHLHYDAQADLIQVLELQNEAATIIYTTHSAGCLPHDLGTGVRAVVPIETEIEGRPVQTDHSRVINKFWTLGPGYAPMLIAMGAGAFAF
ncbi:MAG: AAA family ATPase, partial [Actinobacteria bacterium]|nr:AAA family ATPase [Actinomycetota bacterium]